MFTISVNIKQLEDTFLWEEENYVQNLQQKFRTIWNNVSLGETVISQSSRVLNAHSQLSSMPNEMIKMVQLMPMINMQIR